MEIRERGFIVGDLPVIASISVEPDGDSFRVVYAGQAYTPDEWREFTEAAVYVRDRLANTGASLGPWKRIEDVPDHILCVIDNYGNRWDRNSDHWWSNDTYGTVGPDGLNPRAPFSPKLP